MSNFKNLKVKFDGSPQQAQALTARAEAMGYKLNDWLAFEEGDNLLQLEDDGEYCFYQIDELGVEEEKPMSYSRFMYETKQYATPPCAAHEKESEEEINKEEENDPVQELFNHLHDATGQTFLQDEMNEILKATEHYFIRTGRMKPLSPEEWLNEMYDGKRYSPTWEDMDKYAEYYAKYATL